MVVENAVVVVEDDDVEVGGVVVADDVVVDAEVVDGEVVVNEDVAVDCDVGFDNVAATSTQNVLTTVVVVTLSPNTIASASFRGGAGSAIELVLILLELYRGVWCGIALATAVANLTPPA